MQFIVDNLPLFLTVISALATGLGWGAARIRRGYGLERDIKHLKNDYTALSNSTNQLITELERRMDATEKEIAVIQGINQVFMTQRTSHEQSSRDNV